MVCDLLLDKAVTDPMRQRSVACVSASEAVVRSARGSFDMMIV